jgi:hypothetical protein
MRLAVIAALFAITVAPAFADDDFAGATIIFARGNSLYRVDPKGKNETEIATLAAPGDGKKTVRKLETDAAGKVLLADLDGSWQWMPLDGSAKSLTPLACDDGPAQLAEDGTCVVCRSKGGSQVINLTSGKTLSIDAPGAHVTGTGNERTLVWTDKDGVWAALHGNKKVAKKVAPEPPIRGFLPSPDGSRALGVYSDEIYVDAHHKKPAEILMGFQLDGEAARRKVIKAGVPLEWSHDSEWVLVQNGGEACLMHATGGEYKCWKGYTAASLSPDGRWGLLLGNRAADKPKDPPRGKHRPAPPPRPPSSEPEEATPDSSDEPPDTAIPPPTGPLSLYRARLEGAFTDPPALLVKVVDGAAVWIPAPP